MSSSTATASHPLVDSTHPTVLSFLEFTDSIIHSIKQNQIALQPDVKTDAIEVVNAVSAQRQKTLTEFQTAMDNNKNNTILRNMALETASVVGHAQISLIVNQHTIVAEIVAKYTASTITPTKRVDNVAGAVNSHYKAESNLSLRSGKKRGKKSHKKK
jgi:hypothetical protein